MKVRLYSGRHTSLGLLIRVEKKERLLLLYLDNAVVIIILLVDFFPMTVFLFP